MVSWRQELINWLDGQQAAPWWSGDTSGSFDSEEMQQAMAEIGLASQELELHLFVFKDDE